MIDKGGGRYDLALLDPFIKAMHAQHVLPIWDLCHYGYPDGLDPFGPDFVPRFAAYARAVSFGSMGRTQSSFPPSAP